jgi:hypothetical protein
LKILHDLYPEAISQGDWQGNLPLHVAAMASDVISPEVFKWLASLYPTAMTEANYQGFTCLHLAVDCESSNDHPSLCSDDVNFSKLVDMTTLTPPGTNYATTTTKAKDVRASISSFNAVMTTSSRANSMKTTSQMDEVSTDDVLICRNQGTRKGANRLEIIKFCISHHSTEGTSNDSQISKRFFEDTPSTGVPSIFAEATDDGELPLHLACRNTAVGAEVVSLLLQCHPEAAVVLTLDGNSPLHLAASRSCTTLTDRIQQRRIIQCLLSTYPGAAKVENVEEETPYSLLCGSLTSAECCINEAPTPVPARSIPNVAYMTNSEDFLRIKSSSMTSSGIYGDKGENLYHIGCDVSSGSGSSGGSGIGDSRKRAREAREEETIEADDACEYSRSLRSMRRSARGMVKEVEAMERLLLRANPTENPNRLSDLNWQARRVLLLTHNRFCQSTSESGAVGEESSSSSGLDIDLNPWREHDVRRSDSSNCARGRVGDASATVQNSTKKLAVRHSPADDMNTGSTEDASSPTNKRMCVSLEPPRFSLLHPDNTPPFVSYSEVRKPLDLLLFASSQAVVQNIAPFL